MVTINGTSREPMLLVISKKREQVELKFYEGLTKRVIIFFERVTYLTGKSGGTLFLILSVLQNWKCFA